MLTQLSRPNYRLRLIGIRANNLSSKMELPHINVILYFLQRKILKEMKLHKYLNLLSKVIAKGIDYVRDIDVAKFFCLFNALAYGFYQIFGMSF